MTNIINKLFGKFLAIAFLFGIFSFATFAQSVTLVEKGNSNNRLGVIYTINNNTEYRIDFDGGGYIRIFMPCTKVTKGSVEGNACGFRQYTAGSLLQYSGEAEVYTDATVNLQWKYYYNGDTPTPYYQYGWKEYVPNQK